MSTELFATYAAVMVIVFAAVIIATISYFKSEIKNLKNQIKVLGVKNDSLESSIEKANDDNQHKIDSVNFCIFAKDKLAKLESGFYLIDKNLNNGSAANSKMYGNMFGSLTRVYTIEEIRCLRDIIYRIGDIENKVISTIHDYSLNEVKDQLLVHIDKNSIMLIKNG